MSLAADNRSPCHCTTTSHSAVLYAVLSPTLLTVIDPKKIEKSCSNSFSGLIFQVLRTQGSSVSITLSVFKQKEQKVALRRWVFLGLTQPAIHPAWTRVQKCPADPDRRHFVNSPHSTFQAVLSGTSSWSVFQGVPRSVRPKTKFWTTICSTFHFSKLMSLVLLESVWNTLSEYIWVAICNFAPQKSYGQ